MVDYNGITFTPYTNCTIRTYDGSDINLDWGTACSGVIDMDSYTAVDYTLPEADIVYLEGSPTLILPKMKRIERRNRQKIKQEEKQRRRQLIADQSAKDLLLSLIGEKEMKVFEETGRLYVKGKNHDYIIPKDGFIQRIEKDKIVDLCIHLENRSTLPKVDNVIALKLLVEADDSKVDELANSQGSRARSEELSKCACM